MLLMVFMTDHVMDITCFKTNIDIDVDIDILFSSRRVSGPSTRSACKGWPPASWGRSNYGALRESTEHAEVPPFNQNLALHEQSAGTAADCQFTILATS